MCVEAAKNSEESSAIVVSIGIYSELDFEVANCNVDYEMECKENLLETL